MARQVAHEIKNPLTPIRLGVQHLRRARQNPRVDFDAVLEQNVGRILAEIDRLDEIARAFSRYGTAPTERPPAEPVDVAAVVRDVIALERLGHDGAVDGDGEGDGDRDGPSADGVAWTVDGDGGPALALARDDELREVLLNILENARLAGARSVRVRVGRGGGDAAGDGGDGDRGGRVRLAVSDDGEGIPADALPRVFEPHFSTRTSGSGLGLAISRRIIDGWGGSIEIESERGVGTTVTITLRAAA
jgi:two-component system, NtrC family, nitrogen regulation sensor histidine kinase NtrY